MFTKIDTIHGTGWSRIMVSVCKEHLGSYRYDPVNTLCWKGT